MAARILTYSLSVLLLSETLLIAQENSKELKTTYHALANVSQSEPVKPADIFYLIDSSFTSKGIVNSDKAMLGVHVRKADDTLRSHLNIAGSFGLVVEHISESSAAQKAGLQIDDVIFKLDDQILVNLQQLQTLIDSHQPGDAVKIEFYRGGRIDRIDVELSEKRSVRLDIGDKGINHHHDAFVNDHSVNGKGVLLNDCKDCHVMPDSSSPNVANLLRYSRLNPSKLKSKVDLEKTIYKEKSPSK